MHGMDDAARFACFASVTAAGAMVATVPTVVTSPVCAAVSTLTVGPVAFVTVMVDPVLVTVLTDPPPPPPVPGLWFFITANAAVLSNAATRPTSARRITIQPPA